MNDQVVSKLRDLVRLRQIQGASSFRSAAYSRAADTIEGFEIEIEDPMQLYAVEGIGEKIVSVVSEIIKTGTLVELDEAESILRPVKKLVKIPGIGSKRAVKFVGMGINSVADLKQAVVEGKVRGKKLLDAILFAEMEDTGRIPSKFVLRPAKEIRDKLARLDCVEAVELTGSMRRGRTSVKDADLLVCSVNPTRVVEEFLKFGSEIESGDRKASIFAWYQFGTHTRRFRVDLMIVQRKSWGAALCHFTGSKGHNIKLRAFAKSRGITVSQNGIIGSSGEWLGGEKEEDLYRVLGLEYVEPEGRDED